MSDFYNKYPYTDFHELNLDWVIERVKKLTDDWLATHEEWVGVQQDWADTEQAWIDFKAYVENYLANLDVQDEIDHKINEMILDGSFETIIRPTVQSQAAATTVEWLAAHISQPTTPAIDASLSIWGAAADAERTGQMVATLYDATKTYVVDDYVNYNGVIYRCITDITTPEAFTAAHWRSGRVGNELAVLDKGMAQIDWTATLVPNTGRFWTNDNGLLRLSSYSAVTAFNLIRCRPGDKFVIRTTGVGTAPAYIISDVARNVLSEGVAGALDTELTITDADAYWIAVNATNAVLSSFVFYQSNVNSTKFIVDGITDLADDIAEDLIPSANIVNINNLTYENGFYSDTGAFTASANYSTYQIPITPSTQYTISAFVHFLTFWDYSGAFISSIGEASTLKLNQTFTSPSLARMMKVTFHKVNDLQYINAFMLVLGNALPASYTDPYPTLSSNVHINGYAKVLNAIRPHDTIFNPDFQMVVGSQISDITGAYSTTASANLCADDIFYPMQDGMKYYFWTDGLQYNVYFYDADMNYITSLRPNNNLLNVPYIYINSSNYKYFRVGCYKSGGVANFLHTLHVTMNLQPKKVVCLGDSNTAGNGASIAYHMYLAYKTGWTCLNWGVGGAGWLSNMTSETTVGHGCEGIAPSGVTPDYNTDFVDAVAEIPTDADLYIVFGGYNDWNTNQTEADMQTAVSTVLSYIQDNMPKSRILVITPQQRYKAGVKDGRTPNTAGLTLHDYGRIIKEICEDHAVQCIDLYTESGLYPYSAANATQFYISDGLHLNNYGQKRAYETIVNQAEALMSLKSSDG